MTPNDFRRLALSLPDVTEQSHMDHPDFRVGGKIFATMGYPDAAWAMVSLPPFDQELFVQADPEVFVPVKGAWGQQGATNVRLDKAKKTLVSKALEIARRHRLEKTAASGKARRGGRQRAQRESSETTPKAATISRRSRRPATPSRRRQ
jgi:hypothetical protein